MIDKTKFNMDAVYTKARYSPELYYALNQGRSLGLTDDESIRALLLKILDSKDRMIEEAVAEAMTSTKPLFPSRRNNERTIPD